MFSPCTNVISLPACKVLPKSTNYFQLIGSMTLFLYVLFHVQVGISQCRKRATMNISMLINKAQLVLISIWKVLVTLLFPIAP